MSLTMKVWGRIIETRLRDGVEITDGFMPRKGNHRYNVCFKNVDGKVQGRSKRALLYIRRLRESLQQGSAEELWYCMRKSRVAEKYVRLVQDMYEESEIVHRNYRKFQGQGWTALEISLKSVLVCCDYG